jgi:hypothetical protein
MDLLIASFTFQLPESKVNHHYIINSNTESTPQQYPPLVEALPVSKHEQGFSSRHPLRRYNQKILSKLDRIFLE